MKRASVLYAFLGIERAVLELESWAVAMCDGVCAREKEEVHTALALRTRRRNECHSAPRTGA